MTRIVKILAVVGLLVLCGSAWAVDANDPNLIAHWKFDDGSGSTMDYDGQYFDGIIDDVRIYNRALSDEEIWQHYFDGLDLHGSELSIFAIEYALYEKFDALEKTDAALQRERQAYEALEEMLVSGDYGDLNKRDIAAAQRQVESAIRRQERSRKVLMDSIEKLEDALLSLGLEPEP